MPRQRPQKFGRFPQQAVEARGQQFAARLTVKLQDVIHRRGKRAQPGLQVRHPLIRFRHVRGRTGQQSGEQFHAPQRIADFVRQHGGDFRQSVRAPGGFALGGHAFLLADVAQNPDRFGPASGKTSTRVADTPMAVSAAAAEVHSCSVRAPPGMISLRSFSMEAGQVAEASGCQVSSSSEQTPGFGIGHARLAVAFGDQNAARQAFENAAQESPHARGFFQAAGQLPVGALQIGAQTTHFRLQLGVGFLERTGRLREGQKGVRQRLAGPPRDAAARAPAVDFAGL